MPEGAATDGAATFRVAAAAYDRFVGRYSTELARALVAEATIGPGLDVVDVGCGPGALTAVLVDAVAGGRVAAVDPSEPFARACRDRVPSADVHVARAERLPFGAATFDAALSQLVVNFMSDPEAGVAEMARVVRPGGTVAACVWDYAHGMTLLRGFWDAARDLSLPGAAERDEALMMRYCTPGDLARLWQATGLIDVRTGELVVAADYGSFEDLWAPLESGVGPAGAFATALDTHDRGRLREQLRARLGDPQGPFRLTARAWSAVGRAPAADG